MRSSRSLLLSTLAYTGGPSSKRPTLWASRDLLLSEPGRESPEGSVILHGPPRTVGLRSFFPQESVSNVSLGNSLALVHGACLRVPGAGTYRQNGSLGNSLALDHQEYTESTLFCSCSDLLRSSKQSTAHRARWAFRELLPFVYVYRSMVLHSGCTRCLPLHYPDLQAVHGHHSTGLCPALPTVPVGLWWPFGRSSCSPAGYPEVFIRGGNYVYSL